MSTTSRAAREESVTRAETSGQGIVEQSGTLHGRVATSPSPANVTHFDRAKEIMGNIQAVKTERMGGVFKVGASLTTLGQVLTPENLKGMSIDQKRQLLEQVQIASVALEKLFPGKGIAESLQAISRMIESSSKSTAKAPVPPARARTKDDLPGTTGRKLPQIPRDIPGKQPVATPEDKKPAVPAKKEDQPQTPEPQALRADEEPGVPIGDQDRISEGSLAPERQIVDESSQDVGSPQIDQSMMQGLYDISKGVGQEQLKKLNHHERKVLQTVLRNFQKGDFSVHRETETITAIMKKLKLSEPVKPKSILGKAAHALGVLFGLRIGSASLLRQVEAMKSARLTTTWLTTKYPTLKTFNLTTTDGKAAFKEWASKNMSPEDLESLGTTTVYGSDGKVDIAMDSAAKELAMERELIAKGWTNAKVTIADGRITVNVATEGKTRTYQLDYFAELRGASGQSKVETNLSNFLGILGSSVTVRPLLGAMESGVSKNLVLELNRTWTASLAETPPTNKIFELRKQAKMLMQNKTLMDRLEPEVKAILVAISETSDNDIIAKVMMKPLSDAQRKEWLATLPAEIDLDEASKLETLSLNTARILKEAALEQGLRLKGFPGAKVTINGSTLSVKFTPPLTSENRAKLKSAWERSKALTFGRHQALFGHVIKTQEGKSDPLYEDTDLKGLDSNVAFDFDFDNGSEFSITYGQYTPVSSDVMSAFMFTIGGLNADVPEFLIAAQKTKEAANIPTMEADFSKLMAEANKVAKEGGSLPEGFGERVSDLQAGIGRLGESEDRRKLLSGVNGLMLGISLRTELAELTAELENSAVKPNKEQLQERLQLIEEKLAKLPSIDSDDPAKKELDTLRQSVLTQLKPLQDFVEGYEQPRTRNTPWQDQLGQKLGRLDQTRKSVAAAVKAADEKEAAAAKAKQEDEAAWHQLQGDVLKLNPTSQEVRDIVGSIKDNWATNNFIREDTLVTTLQALAALPDTVKSSAEAKEAFKLCERYANLHGFADTAEVYLEEARAHLGIAEPTKQPRPAVLARLTTAIENFEKAKTPEEKWNVLSAALTIITEFSKKPHSQTEIDQAKRALTRCYDFAVSTGQLDEMAILLGENKDALDKVTPTRI